MRLRSALLLQQDDIQKGQLMEVGLVYSAVGVAVMAAGLGEVGEGLLTV